MSAAAARAAILQRLPRRPPPFPVFPLIVLPLHVRVHHSSEVDGSVAAQCTLLRKAMQAQEQHAERPAEPKRLGRGSWRTGPHTSADERRAAAAARDDDERGGRRPRGGLRQPRPLLTAFR